jgi:glyoxylase-like metal-dependent hydrolase (beta-lactamase superfamily II)
MATRTRLLALVAVLALMVGTATAQDARTAVQAAAKNIGADTLKTIQISGTGWNAAVGQSYSPTEDWPKFEVTSFTKTIDFDAKFSREQLTRRQGNYPPRGGGGTPLQGEQQQDSVVSGNYAWNMQGNNAVPIVRGYLDGIAVAELRQLDILLTPHGFLKAALAPGANPTAVTWTPRGRRVTDVSFTALGKYRVSGTINEQNLVEFVQTRVANPFFGDLLYETRYGPYKDFGGVKFPTVIHHHEGDDRLNPGHNALEIRVSNVQANVTVTPLAVPDSVRAAAPPVRVESQKLADGVWFVGGGSHNSMAVEFRDFVAVVEAPLNEERSLAVIGEVHKLAPNKPIRYVVNTHHHFDHSGGLRTYVAEGATLVTHQGNRDFYEKVLFSPAPRTLQPDRLYAVNPDVVRDPVFETLNQKYVLSDGTRTMDIYAVQGLIHSPTMLIAYLPKEKILVNADLYSPPAPGAAPPATPSPLMVTLNQNIQRLKLDVAQHVPIHGRVGTNDEFVKLVGKPASN